MTSQEPSNSWMRQLGKGSRDRRGKSKIVIALAAAVIVISAAVVTVAESSGANKTSASRTRNSPSTTKVISAGSGSKVRTAAKNSSMAPGGWIATLEAKVKGQAGHLQPGSDPSVLPGPIVIADRSDAPMCQDFVNSPFISSLLRQILVLTQPLPSIESRRRMPDRNQSDLGPFFFRRGPERYWRVGRKVGVALSQAGRLDGS